MLKSKKRGRKMKKYLKINEKKEGEIHSMRIFKSEYARNKKKKCGPWCDSFIVFFLTADIIVVLIFGIVSASYFWPCRSLYYAEKVRKKIEKIRKRGTEK